MRHLIAFIVATAVSTTAATALAQNAEPIYGGNVTNPCAWPTTVSLNGCTGTLVHPEVVIYAAHCGSVGSVSFADNEYAPAQIVATKSCSTHPGYWGEGSGRDIAFCTLSQPVTHIPIVPILMGCETAVLTQGRPVVAVGFGQSNDGLGYGPKREVTMPFNHFQGEEAFVGGNGKDTCFGDSGGPLYVQLDDSSWRVFGITSYGPADGTGDCGGGGFYSVMHNGVDWIEQTSGIDITPCHDAAGSWTPGPDCGHFPLDPGIGGGDWAQGCSTGNVSPMSGTCGVPFDDGSGSGGSGGVGGAGGGAGQAGDPGAGGTGGDPTGAGGSGSPPPGPAPQCDQFEGSCYNMCVCLTKDVAGCADACPAEPEGGGALPPGEDDSSDPSSAGDAGGCGCRAAGSGAPAGASLALALFGVAFARRRRPRRR